jgi:hypothetical protein
MYALDYWSAAAATALTLSRIRGRRCHQMLENIIRHIAAR